MTDTRDLTELIFNPEKGGCVYNNDYKLLTGQFYVDNRSDLTKHQLLCSIQLQNFKFYSFNNIWQKQKYIYEIKISQGKNRLDNWLTIIILECDTVD